MEKSFVPVKDWPMPVYYDPSTKRQLNSKSGEVANESNRISDWDIWTKEVLKAVSEPK